MQPLVSVVIPSYNRANSIERSVISVLRQTYEDLEILLVDDGSTDHTREIVEQLRDPRVRVLTHERRQGGAAARNTGIEAARGSYVAFQDSDDEWLAEKLEKQMRLFLHEPETTGVVYSGFMRIEEAGDETYIPAPTVAVRDGNVNPTLLSGNFIGTPTAVVREECFRKAGLFDSKLPRLHDWELWLRISRHYDFRIIDEPLVYAYSTPDSITASESLYQAHRCVVEKHFEQFSNADHGVLLRHLMELRRLAFVNRDFGRERLYIIRAALAGGDRRQLASLFRRSLRTQVGESRGKRFFRRFWR